MLRIGFLGPKGTFSHEALSVYAKDMLYEACDYFSIQELLQAVQNNEVDEAIAPIENSIEGAVNATLDILATDVDLLIKSELVIPVRENLLVKKGTSLKNISHILSHPQPLGQCRNFINSHFPDAQIRATYSTAGAAEEVAAGSGDSAAIGSSVAAEAYGLEIAEKDIHDCENNHTRFIAVSHTDGDRTGNDRTSIVFSTEDKPGSLYRILDIFSLWDINMSKIESRPAKNQLGRYIFFVDISGHREDAEIRDALTMIRRKSSFYKFLGSYPAYSGDR
ncbi:MAG: prephenate dehydratase [Ruminiclostridium sp.]|nr:prephenate dehydratase [Ruminiclostridium sp.]